MNAATTQVGLDEYVAEIERRGGETAIWTGKSKRNLEPVPLQIYARRDGFVLLRVTGWRFYSKAYGSRLATLAYLCGEDDNGPWAVRIPATVTTIADALTWLTPAAVHKALKAGRRVLRQGDVYAIEMRRDSWGDGLTEAGELPPVEVFPSHLWDIRRRVLVHKSRDGRPHADLSVPFPCRFVQQRVYRMGRSGRRGAGD